MKLLVATLAFTGAYVGVEASRDASGEARANAAAGAPVQTVTLSAESVPVTTGTVPAAGTVTVGAITDTQGCAKPYRVQSVIENADPEKTVSYGWRLERWSVSGKSWRVYMASGSGFTGRSRTVEWEPRIVNNPGWYRVKLSVDGGDVLLSEKFQVSC
ncbi:hypothetical protein GCM10010156_42260 [Planobispora rosea]|uniref:Uncharacterized protein n=1 Tax=Planobispora rosea TaxID=35762 RepID=A0A8J3S422_PLARO|nr:hypothetical protein GCM10010156_42260 [Planobispora rosea]GIH85750.1 hypothetical protein Pro02_41580 [Planobispora rosea]